MAGRKYSVAEIETMRQAVTDLMTGWTYSSNGRSGQRPSTADVEHQLRTYIANETSPEELRDEVDRQREEGFAAARRHQPASLFISVAS